MSHSDAIDRDAPRRASGKRLRRLLALAIAVLLVAGCGAPAMVTPTPDPTLTATRRPTKTTRPTIAPTPTSAPTATPYPVPMAMGPWEGVTVQRICLSVDQEYPQIADSFTQPIERVIAHMLEKLGIDATGPGAECDALMTVDLTLTGLAREYVNKAISNETYHHYTGSATEGKITVEVPGHAALTVPVAYESPPSVMLSIDNDTPKRELPTEAPFSASYDQAIFDGLVQIWGPGMAARLLFDYRPGYNCHHLAERYLKRQAGEAGIPYLIEELERGRPVSYLLEEITGEELGDDSEAWASWWEARR